MDMIKSAFLIGKKIIRRFYKEKPWNPEIFPNVVLIDTTNYCNLRCSMCGRQYMTRKRGRMEMQLVKKILDEIADFNKNTRVWMVFYGEPLTIKKLGLYEMIAYAKEGRNSIELAN